MGNEYIKMYTAICLLNVYAEYIMWNARSLDEAQAGI